MYPMHSDPYPVDVQGPLIASAALEHSRNTSTSVELTAIASMTCAAAAVQDLANVQRPDLPPSPTSVLSIAVAESGEGKSTAAKPFLHPFESLQEKLDQREEERHRFEAKRLVWKARLTHIQAELRCRIEAGGAVEAIENDLARHLDARTRMQPRPKLLYDNVTPVAIRRHLAAWPSGLVASMDAGHILNGAVGRDLDLLNSLWDGDTVRADSTDGSSTAYAPRVSALLYTQPAPTLRYLARRGADAHGTGFFARVDWAFLPPTKGTRLIDDAPKSHQSVESFQARVTELLQQRIHARKAGDDTRQVIGFSPSGSSYFKDLYKRLLAMSAPGGVLQALGGYAAKMPERVARYACIIHVFNKLSGSIGDETLHHAELIIHWHTRQFLNMLALTSPETQAMHDGQGLEQLLWAAAQRGEMIRPADLQRICPLDWGRPRRNRALQVLCASGRARIERWKHNQYVQLSSMPQLSISLAAQEARILKR